MNKELIALRARVIVGMIEFLSCTDDYTQDDVDRCEEILNRFLNQLDDIPEEDKQSEILEVAKKTVIALNQLNDSCGGTLIETDQRESICELIIEASKQAGLVTVVYDITEDWREW